MADVYQYIVNTGVILVDAGEILTQVQNEYKDTFGQDLDVSPQTPQGALIATETLDRISLANNNAKLANQLNPNIAGGVYLDAIGALTGVTRESNRYSSITNAVITGVPGTVIAAGSQASETVNGAVFQTVDTITIPIGGTITNVSFRSVLPGEIPCSANTLTQIITNILGWETLNNPTAATLGQLQQSDESYKQYRADILSQQGSNLAQAVKSSVRRVTGVSDVFFQENYEDVTQVKRGVTMQPHSLYVCVSGSGFSNSDVGLAIIKPKSGGCGFNNGASATPESVVVVNQYSGQSITVLFDIADTVAIAVEATVSVVAAIQNPQTAVVNSILDYVNGNISGIQGLKIGTPVSSFELAGAITTENPGIFVKSLKTKKLLGGSFSSDEIEISVFEIASINSTNISVTIV